MKKYQNTIKIVTMVSFWYTKDHLIEILFSLLYFPKKNGVGGGI